MSCMWSVVWADFHLGGVDDRVRRGPAQADEEFEAFAFSESAAIAADSLKANASNSSSACAGPRRTRSSTPPRWKSAQTTDHMQLIGYPSAGSAPWPALDRDD